MLQCLFNQQLDELSSGSNDDIDVLQTCWNVSRELFKKYQMNSRVLIL